MDRSTVLLLVGVLVVLGFFGFVIVPLLVGLVKLLVGLAVIAAFVGVGVYVYRR